jgi:hypothetical protein
MVISFQVSDLMCKLDRAQYLCRRHDFFIYRFINRLAFHYIKNGSTILSTDGFNISALFV